jgi:Skp family chaperone for outer membrane proteins
MSRVSCIAIFTLVLATPAVAQQPGGQSLGGPQVQGVCLLSQQAVVANAKVGVAATARLKQLASQAQSDVEAARAPIQADAKALEAQRATMKPADFEAKSQALGARYQVLQQAAQGKSQQVELTRQKVLAQIASAAQPVIAQVYKAKGCGLLVDRSAVLGGNMGGDLTQAVVEGLDAKMTTISFDLAPLPTQAASTH